MKMWKAATLSVRTPFFPIMCVFFPSRSALSDGQTSNAAIFRVTSAFILRATAGPGCSGQPIAAPHYDYDARSIYSTWRYS